MQADSDNQAGVENEGYWGIPMRPNTAYKASFYAKSGSASIGPVTVRVIDDNTGKPVTSGVTPPLTSDWKEYKLTLATGNIATSAANHLVLTVAHPGSVWFDLVSLFRPLIGTA